jgi:exosortase
VTSGSLTRARSAIADWHALAPWLATGLAFLVLYWEPLATLGRDWRTDPDTTYGVLLLLAALYLAWRRGLAPAVPAHGLGVVLIVAAVTLRYLSGLAAEVFTMRLSVVLATCGLIAFARGTPQLRRWELPLILAILSIPLPAVLLGSITWPLQLEASRIGAALLASRHVPMVLSGNIIELPGRTLFVAEACSGLRSLTALLALGVLAGGLWLHAFWARALLVALTVPVALALNGVRIFLTGFFVFFLNPQLADGFLHYTQGWVLFVVAFAILGALAAGLMGLEHRLGRGA